MVRPDICSHSGIAISLQKGAAYSNSSKQNWNTKISTEAELVATYDAMAHVLRTQHF